MRFDCIVLDFDGTFTQVDEEAAPFFDGYRAAVEAIIAGTPGPSWNDAVARILRDPDAFGWLYEGHIVAPSHADPYVLATSTAQLLFDEHRLLGEKEARADAMRRLFAENYPKSRIAFRPEAKHVVEQLLDARIPIFVVTNSHTHAVAAKIDALAPRGQERLEIRGDARKFVLEDRSDPRFDLLPREASLAGLARPIYLRRGPYFDTLSEIWRETGATPERTFVCGDIFELDLAMPARLGAHVHLVTRPGTPAWERNAVRAVPHGAESATLDPVLARVLG